MAKTIQVTPDVITFWEKNKNKLTPKYVSAITKFLGYFPYLWEKEDLNTRVKHARMVAGHTFREMGKEISVDSATLYKTLCNKSRLMDDTIMNIKGYIHRYLLSN